jgi:hypothetical protein
MCDTSPRKSGPCSSVKPLRFRFQIALLILFAALPSLAQRGGGGPKVSFQLIVVREGERMPIAEPVTVTLRNEWGDMVGAEDLKSGFSQWYIRPGLYRLSIAGPCIETYFDEFTLENTPTWTETVRVRAKRNPGGDCQPAMAAGTAQPIAAVRLNIPGKARKEYEKALSAVKKNDEAVARAHLNQAITFYPSYDLAFFELGKLELNAGHRDAAIKDFQMATKLNDGFADAHRELAKIFLAEKNYVSAEPDLLATLRSQPHDLWTLSFAALDEFELGRFAEAIALAGRVHSDKHPGYASAHLIAAKSLEALHRLSEAAEQYRQYLQEDPNGANVQRAREALARLASAQQPQAVQTPQASSPPK